MEKAHEAALQTRHEGLEARIDAEHHRPLPDDLAIARLKKEKLRLKDELGTN